MLTNFRDNYLAWKTNTIYKLRHQAPGSQNGSWHASRTPWYQLDYLCPTSISMISTEHRIFYIIYFIAQVYPSCIPCWRGVPLKMYALCILELSQPKSDGVIYFSPAFTHKSPHFRLVNSYNFLVQCILILSPWYIRIISAYDGDNYFLIFSDFMLLHSRWCAIVG